MSTQYKYYTLRNADTRNRLSCEWHFGVDLDTLAACMLDGIYDDCKVWEQSDPDEYDEFNRPDTQPDWSFAPPSDREGKGPHPSCTIYNNVYKWDDTSLPANSNTADCADWLVANLRQREAE